MSEPPIPSPTARPGRYCTRCDGVGRTSPMAAACSRCRGSGEEPKGVAPYQRPALFERAKPKETP